MSSGRVHWLRRYARSWGATDPEMHLTFPCDRYLDAPDDTAWRAVDIRATPATVYRWLCQLRVAPYSYDWIDNFARTSPRRLIGGLEELAVGQRVMTIFTVVAFERDTQLTIALATPRARRIFGEVVVTYAVLPAAGDASRLVAKVLFRYPRRGFWIWMRGVLPWGDLVMMRKQLLTLKALAERSS